MQGDPYGTQSGVYGLAHLIHSYLTQGMRYEPPPPGPDVAAVQGPQIVANELQRNPDAVAAGENILDAEMDKVMTDQWKQRMQEGKEANQRAIAMSPQGKAKAFVNKMRAAKSGQKGVERALFPPTMPEQAPNLIFGPKRTNPDEPTGKPPPVE